MIKCKKCLAEIPESSAFCGSCGEPVNSAEQTTQQSEQAAETTNTTETTTEQTAQTASDQGNSFAQNISFDSKDSTAEFDAKDIEENKVISLFSYIGILFLIPMLAKPDSKYAKFHANQGIALFIVSIAVTIVKVVVTAIVSALLLSISYTLYRTINSLVSLVFNALSLAVGVVAILGIINAVTGKAKTLPLIGGFKILK